MHYTEAYLHMFNRLTDIIKLLESIDETTEYVDVALLLKQVQAEGEEQCIQKGRLRRTRNARPYVVRGATGG